MPEPFGFHAWADALCSMPGLMHFVPAEVLGSYVAQQQTRLHYLWCVHWRTLRRIAIASHLWDLNKHGEVTQYSDLTSSDPLNRGRV